MSGGKPVFGKPKEVEIVLSVSTIWVTEIHQFIMMGQGEFFPSVEAQGEMASVRVERASEEGGLLDWLRQM